MLHLKTTKTNSNEKHYYINYWHLSHIDAGIVHQCLWSGISDSPDDYSATAITSNPQTQEAVDPSENLPKAGNLSAVLILEQTINGTVTDGDGGEPLPGVNVLAKGTTMGTVTDIEGKYQLTVSDGVEALVFSSIGYETREVVINGQEVINLELMPDVQALSEVVVVGYGVQQKKSLTGSVNSVDAEELKEVTVPNATQLLQGRVPGVITKQSSGLPGQDNANISIRGFGNPLILVDGMERSLSNVDPNDIESISVLKDASAAIYGARSGNGVILVTTKRGNQGKPQFTYDGTYSV